MKNYQRELTDKQKKFCDLILGGMNDARAALQAGYSRSTAYSGWLMTLPLVKKYLKEHESGQSAGDVKIAADRVLAELCKIAFANVVNCFNTDGSVRRFDDVDLDTMASVQSITISETGAVKIKMYNKLVALERIAKRINFYSATEKPQTVVAEEVIPGDHPDFVDDDADYPNAIAEMEDFMAGKTGDDYREDDDAIVVKTAEVKTDDGEVDPENNEANTWLKQRYAKQIEDAKLQRKAEILAADLAGSGEVEAGNKTAFNDDDGGGKVVLLNGQQGFEVGVQKIG